MTSTSTMQTLKDYSLKFLFTIVSLETLMKTYTYFTSTYEIAKKKMDQTYKAISQIWWETSPKHHYSGIMGDTWVYQPEESLLWSVKHYSITNPKLKTLPWLSAELYYGSTKLADCSDFVTSLHYRGYDNGTQMSLTTDIILQAWAETYAHTINYEDLGAYQFKVIDEMGNDANYNLGMTVA